MLDNSTSKNSWKQGVIGVLASVVFTFVVGEIAVRVISSFTPIYNIEMAKYAKSLKRASPDGKTSHVHVPNAKAHLMGVDIELNSLGHRGRELANPKPTNTKRIFVLGSSATMGWGVPLEKVFTSVAEEKLNTVQPFKNWKFEFANAGIAAYNTEFQYALFTQQYDTVKPDFVLLHYFINDAEWRSTKKNSAIFKYSMLAALLYERLNMFLFMFDGKPEGLLEHYKKLYEKENPNWIRTQGYLKELKEKTSKDHVPLLVMIIPDFHSLSKDSPYAPIYGSVEKTISTMGLEVINTFPAFSEKFGSDESKVWIQEDDPHPNALGHQFMADIFYQYFTQKNPLHL